MLRSFYRWMKGAFFMQETLILEAKSGNEDSLMTLYRQYHPLVYALRKKYFLRDLDEQDWLQEGLIVFYGCIQAYETQYGVSFGALFKRSFENRIRSLIRKECAYKRKTNAGALSFEELVMDGFESGCEYPTLYDNPLQQLIVEEVFQESQKNLSPLEMKALLTSCLSEAMGKKEKEYVSAYNRSRRKVVDYFNQVR